MSNNNNNNNNNNSNIRSDAYLYRFINSLQWHEDVCRNACVAVQYVFLALEFDE
jgi:hypothetical protein